MLEQNEKEEKQKKKELKRQSILNSNKEFDEYNGDEY